MHTDLHASEWTEEQKNKEAEEIILIEVILILDFLVHTLYE